MKKIIFLLAFLPLLFACSNIADDEQLIYVKPQTAKRAVLIEDFTGQKCINCPLGTEVIEQLQETYGDRVIAVGIHSGPLGFAGNSTAIGLATAIGDEYFNYWQLEYQPEGLINRHGAVNYLDWITKVREELTRESSVSMKLEAQLVEGKISISVESEVLGDDYQGRLQVWVLEDGIVATQKMPDGSTNKEYVHNHVFRTTVNGTWGDPIVLTGGEKSTRVLTQTVDENWNTANLSVVAFVYNDNGVEQAIKANVTQ